jgi:membrane-associated phospholipid phosphatase
MMATSVAVLSPSAFADREEATVWTAAKKPDFGFDLTHASSAAPGDEPSGGGGKTLDPAWEAPEWLGGKPNMGTWLAEGIVVGGWVALWIDDDVGTTEETGEYTQLIPPATALGMALGTKDWKGTKQLIWSGLLSGGTVHLLKNVIEKNRPDASNTQSFPSGHTNASFWGASFILRRYGPKWGIPAMTIAAYTGWSRVQAQSHFADDVISGMSIALFSNWLFVEPADPERAARDRDLERPRNYRFEWEIGDGNVTKNLVQAPAGTGTVIDYRFAEEANPQITASVAFDKIFKERHNLKLRYAPFEGRDIGTVDDDTIFDGVVIPAHSDVHSVYRSGDLRLRYAYDFVPQSRFRAQLGGGLTYIDTKIELFPADLSASRLVIDVNGGAKVCSRGVLPILYTKLGVDFTMLIGLYVEADWMDHSDDSYLDTAAKLRFQVNPKWDLALGYRVSQVKVDLDDSRNDVEVEGALIHVGYSF